MRAGATLQVYLVDIVLYIVGPCRASVAAAPLFRFYLHKKWCSLPEACGLLNRMYDSRLDLNWSISPSDLETDICKVDRKHVVRLVATSRYTQGQIRGHKAF